MNKGTLGLSASVLFAACAALNAGQPTAGKAAAALERLQAQAPEVQVDREGARITRAYGQPLAHGVSAVDAAEQFRTQYADAFGALPEELVAGGLRSDAPETQPVMYDGATGEFKFTLVYYRQFRSGIPVFGAEMRVLVRSAADYPVVLAASSVRELGDFVPTTAALRFDPTQVAAVPAIGQTDFAGQPLAPAGAALINFTTPEPVIWAGVDDDVTPPRSAATFIGDNYGDPKATRPERWRFVVDPATGEILHRENLICFTNVSGNVSGMVTEGPKAEQCAAEVSTPFAYATASISGGSSVYADVDGNFTIPNAGTAAVTVQSPMSGHYFTVDNYVGTEEALSQSVVPPGPANFLHNPANTDELVRAQANAYANANEVRDFVLRYNPTYPVVYTQTGFLVHVNRTDGYCPGNAWYDGSSLNFCQSSIPTYPNTSFASVSQHEYGHHLVQVAGSGQDQYGEGMGDCISMLIADDSGLGYGFYYNQCNTPLRNANNTLQYPCTGEVHACAGLLSGCVWSTRNQLLATNPGTYRDIIGSLTVNSILLHTGGTTTPQIYTDFLTLDDNDSNLGNGTPHYAEITAGFAAHNMVPQPPPANDTCASAIPVCPGTAYPGSTASASVDGSAGCGTSNATPDVWYRYTPSASGTATFSLCTGTSYDSVMSVHSGCPGSSSNQLNCDDDGCGGYSAPSTITRSVTAGQTYLIRISGYDGSVGAYTLNLTGPACVPSATCNDGVQNQGEQRIDCGGPCPACQCVTDAACNNSVFCDGTETCNTFGQCQAGSVPCGGGTWCYEGGTTCVAFGNGDFDVNGHVDLADVAVFQTCFGALGLGSCQPGNLTGDGTIQLDDFSAFENVLTGP